MGKHWIIIDCFVIGLTNYGALFSDLLVLTGFYQEIARYVDFVEELIEEIFV